MGRKSTYTAAVADEICARISKGETLASICREDGMPGVTTVHDWREEYPDFAESFARARDKGFDAIAEDCVAIADTAPPSTPAGGTDSGYVQHQKLRIETRLKLLAKWDPRRYGDKVEHEHKGGLNLQVVTGVPDAG